MANQTVSTSTEEDAAIQNATAEYNKGVEQPSRETAAQFFQRNVRHLIANWVTLYRDSQRLNRGDLYNKATVQDQSAVDAILAKYQG